MINSELKHLHHAHKLLKRTGHHRGITSLFGVCKTGLVLHIEYYGNIKTLISKFELNMWQHDLTTLIKIRSPRLMHDYRVTKN